MQRTLMASLIDPVVYTGNASSPALAVEAKQPDPVIVTMDDLGYGDLATYDHQIVKTSNIDRFAQEGVKFTDYYASAPLSLPSHTGLLTGQMPFCTGIRSWISSGKDAALGCNKLTIANLLKAQGYDTVTMGKLHLNADGDRTDQPQVQDMGFDYSLTNMAGFVTDATLDNVKERPCYGMVYSTGWLRNGQPTPQADKMSGEYVSPEVVNWLDNKKDSKPFLLYVALTEVYSPLTSPKKHLDMYS